MYSEEYRPNDVLNHINMMKLNNRLACYPKQSLVNDKCSLRYIWNYTRKMLPIHTYLFYNGILYTWESQLFTAQIWQELSALSMQSLR